MTERRADGNREIGPGYSPRIRTSTGQVSVSGYPTTRRSPGAREARERVRTEGHGFGGRTPRPSPSWHRPRAAGVPRRGHLDRGQRQGLAGGVDHGDIRQGPVDA
jgi:hypothetical protein